MDWLILILAISTRLGGVFEKIAEGSCSRNFKIFEADGGGTFLLKNHEILERIRSDSFDTKNKIKIKSS